MDTSNPLFRSYLAWYTKAPRVVPGQNWVTVGTRYAVELDIDSGQIETHPLAHEDPHEYAKYVSQVLFEYKTRGARAESTRLRVEDSGIVHVESMGPPIERRPWMGDGRPDMTDMTTPAAVLFCCPLRYTGEPRHTH